MTTYTYYIHQMHCASCKILVAEVLTDLNLKNSTIDLKTKQITFQTNLLPADFLTSLTAKLAEYSYSLSDSSSIKSESLTTPFLTALFFVITFLLLDKLGLSKLLNPSQITLPVVFVIGILASLSTCMALVGGLLLGLSQTKGSHLLFHLSRLVSFFILGGAIGFLGQNLIFTPAIHSIFLFILSLSLLLLGLSNLHIKSIQAITFPNILGKKLNEIKTSSNPFLPVLLGAITFILPCGFTQSMQLYSLSLGSPFASALTMLVFATGTLPILALISFSTSHFKSGKISQTFLQTIGFLLIFLALWNLKSLLGI